MKDQIKPASENYNKVESLFNAKKSGNSILSFGELLLRICPDDKGLWTEKKTVPIYIGGAEANVATALALWGMQSSYFTVLPENLLAQQLVSYLKNKLINISRIQFQGERIGMFFLPHGSDMKNSAVIYDRKYSSFDQLKSETLDWPDVLKDISWLHMTAISPALNQQVANVSLEAVTIASSLGIKVSFDLNYRPQLWKYGKTPSEVIPEIASTADLIMGNLWSAQKMLNTSLNDSLNVKRNKKEYLQSAEDCSREILRKFPKCKAVALTFRLENAPSDPSAVLYSAKPDAHKTQPYTDQGKDGSSVNYYSTLYTEAEGLITSEEYSTTDKIDKVGSGDCFMAGLIYGINTGLTARETLEFATIAAFSKLFIHADATTMSVEEINDFIKKQ